jgi:cobyrinic acid a,c-diamide synthase
MMDTAMTITKQTVADRIAAYLHHEMTLAQLVDWAENAMMDGELSERDAKTISSVIARLGVADVRAFGLAWDDCEELLHKPGFSPRVEVVAT